MTKSMIHVIGGPTASGKSAYALNLADKYDGVVINADSMQIYDGLHLLTAQPPSDDLTQYPHKLYSALHPNKACSAGNWREMVEPLITDILDNGQTPIIVGGSGLYIKALIDGLSPIPDIPDLIRQQADLLQKELGNPGFYNVLKERDPIMADRLHPYHTARLIRAWEVLESTGKSLAQWQTMPLMTVPDHWQFHVTLVMPPRPILYDRCNQRFLHMMDHGVLEEVTTFSQKIATNEVADHALLTKALGYQPLNAYLIGTMSLDDAIARAQTDTRHYAKRQVTWFRHQVTLNKNVAKIDVIE